jgi:hypothetical protein
MLARCDAAALSTNNLWDHLQQQMLRTAIDCLLRLRVGLGMADKARALSENEHLRQQIANFLPLASLLSQLRYLHEMILQDISSWLSIAALP